MRSPLRSNARTLRATTLTALVAATLLAACSKNHASSAAPPVVATSTTQSPYVGDEAKESKDKEKHGEGKGRFGETVVYLDGKPISVMRAAELPLGIKPVAKPEWDGLDVARYYYVYDYLQGLGVDLTKLDAVQFYGSHDRVATIHRAELAKYKKALIFDFTQQTTGKARARWSLAELKAKINIDQIYKVAIYVDKKAPTYDRAKGGLFFEPGKTIDYFDVPYGTGDAPKGTRVYVDGKLAGWVKRRTLSNKSMIEGTDANPHFSVERYLDELGVDVRNARAVDFLSGDDLAARVSKEQLGEFTLPKRSHGKVLAHFAGDKASMISSIQVYVRQNPPERSPEPEVLEAEQADDADGNNGPRGQQNQSDDE